MQLKEEAPHFKQSFFGSARVRQTNQTALVTLDSTGDKEWIVKSITEKSLGPLETLSQEFFRLLIPHQPETRLIAKHEPVEPQRDNSQYIGNEGRIQLVIATLPPLVCVKNFNRTFIV